MPFAFFLALLMGLSLGMLGGGGSVIALPVLVHVAGVPPREAVAMSLAIVGATSLAGSYLHYRDGHFDGRATLVFGGTGIAGALLGSSWTHAVSEDLLMVLFAGLMLPVAASMLRARPEPPPGVRCNAKRCAAIGFVVGALTGFLGVGGGFLIVPALVLLAGIETKKAIGSSLGIIAINSAAGIAGHLRYTLFPAGLALGFLAMALAGMFAGVWLAEHMPARAIRKSFAFVLIGIGLSLGTVHLRQLLH